MICEKPAALNIRMAPFARTVVLVATHGTIAGGVAGILVGIPLHVAHEPDERCRVVSLGSKSDAGKRICCAGCRDCPGSHKAISFEGKPSSPGPENSLASHLWRN